MEPMTGIEPAYSAWEAYLTDVSTFADLGLRASHAVIGAGSYAFIRDFVAVRRS